MSEPVDVSADKPKIWEGEITQWMLQEIVRGLLIPNEEMARRLAQELLTTRKYT